MGRNEHERSVRVHVVGDDAPETRAVEEGVEGFESETFSSVASLTPAAVTAVLVVAPAIDAPTPVAVRRIRRMYDGPAVVVVADDVPTVRADAVTPVDADEVAWTVQSVVDERRIETPERRLLRVGALVSHFDDGDDVDRICEKLTDGVGYESAWIVQSDGDEVEPVAAAGVPVSALRTVDADDDASWARAVRSGEPVADSEGDRSVVAVPFEEGCLVCVSADPVTTAEVEALEYVVSALASVDGDVRPRYALLGDAVAHEVNNQLDIAMVHLDLVDEHGEHLEHVEMALSRIAEVVEEVDALLSPELSLGDVALGPVSRDVWDAVVDESASLEVRPGAVEADERLVRLLLSNLFRNAAQHGGEDVSVEVGPLDGGGFYVTDDGDGFPDASPEQLFEWGHSESGGTGIGLALVSLVADRHDWETTVDGEDGARFEFHP